MASRRLDTKKGAPWSRDEDALLGEFPDDEVARRTNRMVKAVISRRKKLGIPQFDR